MTGRGPRPILRRKPEGGNGGMHGASRFKYAVFRIAAKPVALRGFLRVSRSIREAEVSPVQNWHRHSQERENDASAIGAPERPSGIGELINSLLRAGYSMTQIRAMYPGLFSCGPSPGG